MKSFCRLRDPAEGKERGIRVRGCVQFYAVSVGFELRLTQYFSWNYIRVIIAARSDGI